jgi:hypothetical protein
VESLLNRGGQVDGMAHGDIHGFGVGLGAQDSAYYFAVQEQVS